MKRAHTRKWSQQYNKIWERTRTLLKRENSWECKELRHKQVFLLTFKLQTTTFVLPEVKALITLIIAESFVQQHLKKVASTSVQPHLEDHQQRLTQRKSSAKQWVIEACVVNTFWDELESFSWVFPRRGRYFWCKRREYVSPKKFLVAPSFWGGQRK